MSSTIAGQLDDVSTVVATENDPAPVRITTQRALHVNLRDSSGNELGVVGGSISAYTNIITTGSTYGNKNYTTAAKASVGASALVGRHSLTVTPINVRVYWGYNSSVTTSTGIPIDPLQMMIWDIDATQDVYLISSSGTADVRLSEGK